jgi:hypothetical protein
MMTSCGELSVGAAACRDWQREEARRTKPSALSRKQRIARPVILAARPAFSLLPALMFFVVPRLAKATILVPVRL